MEGRLLTYDAEAAPVQRCLWVAVTAAQDEPSLAPWLGPAEQHAYGSMPAAAVDKVFEHLHAAHDALDRTGGCRQPSLTGSDPARGEPPESGKRLQAAILRYDALAACAPAAYQANPALHAIHSEAALRLTEELQPPRASYRRSWRGNQPPSKRTFANRAQSCPPTASALSETSGAATPNIAQRWKAVRGAIEVEALGPSGLWNLRVPNTETLLTEALDVMFAVRALWRELYDKRQVDLPGFQAVLGHHVPQVPEGAWAQIRQYSMPDLRSALDKADGMASGPNHVEPRFIKASRPPSSGSPSTPAGPRRRCTGEMRTSVSAPRCRAPPGWTSSCSRAPSPSASRRCSRDTAWSAIGSRGPSPAPIPFPPCSWRSGSSSGEGPSTSYPSTPARPSTPPRTAHSTSPCATSLCGGR